MRRRQPLCKNHAHAGFGVARHGREPVEGDPPRRFAAHLRIVVVDCAGENVGRRTPLSSSNSSLTSLPPSTRWATAMRTLRSWSPINFSARRSGRRFATMALTCGSSSSISARSWTTLAYFAAPTRSSKWGCARYFAAYCGLAAKNRSMRRARRSLTRISPCRQSRQDRKFSSQSTASMRCVVR